MRILVDEDSQAHLLIRALRAAGHDVLSATEAGLEGEPDNEVLARASAIQRTLLTSNVRDFHALHLAGHSHYGILGIHHDSETRKDMSSTDIARAVANLEASGWALAGQFVTLNDWQFVQE